MNTQKLLLAALLAGAFAPALAFDADDEQAHTEKHVVVMNSASGMPAGDFAELRALDGLRFAGPQMRMHGKPVKGAPYSAEVINEQQQNLADGNQIVTRHSSLSLRDGAGRTRQEVRDDKGEVRSITIHDPASGTTYILKPSDKTAIKVGLDKEIGKAAAEAAKARIEQMKKDGKLKVSEGPNGEHIVIAERFDSDLGKQISENVMVRVEKSLADVKGQHIELKQIGPIIAGAFGDMKWSGKAVSKDLGSKDIEGVKAEGKLRSYEIPAGEVGNRNAITVSDESWYSPELQVTVYSKHSDPRSGERVYRLASLKREEPAAALFTLPSDYTVKDVMANVKRTIIEKK
ncbi:MAG: hypothetical protein V4508_00540 [Pseudomonadota bacterium]